MISLYFSNALSRGIYLRFFYRELFGESKLTDMSIGTAGYPRISLRVG